MEVTATAGPGARRRASAPPAARSARRASCRWAPGERCGTLSSGRPRRPRRADRARQHVPPHAEARRRRDRAPRAGCTASPTGPATSSPTPAATRSSRSSPAATSRLDDDGVTFRSTYDGGTHRLTPESAVDIQTHARQRHPDGARRVRAAARRRRRCCGRRSTAPRAWAARARAAFLAQDRPELNQFGIVQGGTDLRAARRERRAHPRGRVRRLRHRRAVGRGVAGRHARDARPPRSRCLPDDQPRYLMGLGDPIGMVEAVALGHRPVRLRAARPASPATARSCPAGGRYNLKRAENTAADAPLDDDVRLPGVRPLVPGLPAPPPGGRRAHRAPAAHPPQPVVDAAPWSTRSGPPCEAGTLEGVRSRIAAAYG